MKCNYCRREASSTCHVCSAHLCNHDRRIDGQRMQPFCKSRIGCDTNLYHTKYEAPA